MIGHADFQGALQNTVYSAIARVISDCPTLCAAIKNADSKKPTWIHIGSVDLDEHVQWIELDESMDADEFLQEKISAEIDTRFSGLGYRPGWRVVVIQHASNDALDVIFTWNHAHSDGMGGKIFLEKLLVALSTSRNTDSKSLTRDGRKLDCPHTSTLFPPCTETLTKLPTSTEFLLQQFWNEKKPACLFPRQGAANWAPMVKDSYKTKFRTCSIDRETLSGILKACRHRKTTITALLHGLVLMSLASQLREEQAQTFTSFTAIDQRRFLPSRPLKYPWLEPSKTVANYVTSTGHDFYNSLVAQMRSCNAKYEAGHLSTEQLKLVWSAASKVREDIESRLKKGLKDDRVGLMKLVSNAQALFEKGVQKPRQRSWLVSNLGVVDGTAKDDAAGIDRDQEAWDIRRVRFTLSAQVPDAALLLAAVSVKGGEFILTCTWQDGVVEDALAELVVGHLKKWLDQIGTAGRDSS